jgi:hypothetical protein
MLRRRELAIKTKTAALVAAEIKNWLVGPDRSRGLFRAGPAGNGGGQLIGAGAASENLGAWRLATMPRRLAFPPHPPTQLRRPSPLRLVQKDTNRALMVLALFQCPPPAFLNLPISIPAVAGFDQGRGERSAPGVHLKHESRFLARRSPIIAAPQDL